MQLRKVHTGFSLLEIMFVLVIMSMILSLLITYTTQKSAAMRRDKAAMQIQQILNAGLSYYVNNGQWPVTCGTAQSLSGTQTLQAGNYLPTSIPSPWGSSLYSINCNATTGLFIVTVSTAGLTAAIDAQIVAGMVPNGSVTGNTTINSSVNIPGENLNNARSVNFAGTYNPGGCVPVPACPGNMQAQIYVTPATINSYTDPNGISGNLYQIMSFAAYAVAPGNPPGNCANNPSNTNNCTSTNGTTYWRVCLNLVTSNGSLTNTTSTSVINSQTLIAITRCAPSNEPVGSTFNVY